MSRCHAAAKAFLLALILLTACEDGSGVEVTTPPSRSVSPSAIKISVENTGLYRVPFAQLQAAGMPGRSLGSRELALYLGDRSIPFWVQGSTFYFYGQAPTDRYTSSRVYVLRWSQSEDAGSLMRSESLPAAGGPPVTSVHQTLRLEQNQFYVSRAAPYVSEPWFWQRLGPGPSIDLTFLLPAALRHEGEIRICLWGLTSDGALSPDHRVALVLNDQRIGTAEWDGEAVETATFPVPAGLLREGANTLSVAVIGNTGSQVDLSYLDWLEIEYLIPVGLVAGMLELPNVSGDVSIENAALLFDVTDPSDPAILTVSESDDGGLDFHLDAPRSLVALSLEGGLLPESTRPLRSSEALDGSQGADYLIVAPAELTSALGPLVAARADQGLSPAVVPLEEIYDRFGDGAETPGGIRSFLQYAYQEWPLPHPRFLLLVGDATYDFRNYLGLSPRYSIPPLLVSASHGGETVSDSRLVDLDDDGRPDLAVGRWPVSSPETVASLVERTLAYEAAREISTRSLFVIDETEATFARIADRQVQAAGLEESAQILRPSSAEAVVDAWNQGAWLVNYVGHGSLSIWGRTDLFNRTALGQLVVGQRPPIVVHFTCLTGYFAHPTQACLAEEMVWHPGGPVSVIAATSLTLPSHQEPFAVALVEALADSTVVTVGDALLQAQRTPGIDQEVVDTFILLGDPALAIARPD